MENELVPGANNPAVPSSAGRFAALDGWRGLLALSVALFHLSALSHITAFPLTRHAFLAVDFFFALSGFVLAHAYAGRLDTAADGARFLVRRIGRIWPLHVAALTALAAWELVKLLVEPHLGEVAPFSGPRTPIALLENLLLVQGWGASHAPTWNVPSWSISVELALYLMFAGLCLFGRRRLLTGALVLAGVGLLATEASAHSIDVTCDLGVFRGMAGFFLGVIVRFLPPLRAPRAAASQVEGAATLAAALFVLFAPGTPAEFCAPLVFAAMVWVFASDGGVVSRMLASGPVQRLGLWSYSIYLIHFPLVVGLGVVRKALEHVTHAHLTVMRPSSEGPVQVLFVHSYWVMDLITLGYLAVVVAIAALTYRLVEQPGRVLFNRWAEALPMRLAQSTARLAAGQPAS